MSVNKTIKLNNIKINELEYNFTIEIIGMNLEDENNFEISFNFKDDFNLFNFSKRLLTEECLNIQKDNKYCFKGEKLFNEIINSIPNNLIIKKQENQINYFFIEINFQNKEIFKFNLNEIKKEKENNLEKEIINKIEKKDKKRKKEENKNNKEKNKKIKIEKNIIKSNKFFLKDIDIIFKNEKSKNYFLNENFNKNEKIKKLIQNLKSKLLKNIEQKIISNIGCGGKHSFVYDKSIKKIIFN